MNQMRNLTHKESNRDILIIQLQSLTKEQLISVILKLTDQSERFISLLLQANEALQDVETLLIEANAQIEVFYMNYQIHTPLQSSIIGDQWVQGCGKHLRTGFRWIQNKGYRKIFGSMLPELKVKRVFSTKVVKKHLPSERTNKMSPSIDNKINKNLFYISSHISSLYRILNTINDYFPSYGENTLGALFGKITKIWKTNGLVFLIKYLKSVRLHCTRYMVGQPLISKENEPVKVSLDKDYFPKILLPWKSLFTSKSERRCVGFNPGHNIESN